jgi:hypothetical protein
MAEMHKGGGSNCKRARKRQKEENELRTVQMH